jgi:hypothetical protein
LTARVVIECKKAPPVRVSYNTSVGFISQR